MYHRNQSVVIIADNIVGIVVGIDSCAYLVRFTYNGASQIGLFYEYELRLA